MDSGSSSTVPTSDIGNVPKWKHKDVGDLSRWCLLDNPNLWKHSGIPEDLISSNSRLQKLKGQPKNKIVVLPLAQDVARQFYCADCTDIPFPWTPIPPKRQPTLPVSKAALLCQNGHAICRNCYQSFSKCVFGVTDFKYVFQDREENESFRYSSFPKRSVGGSIGSWGRTRLCLASTSAFKCMFLTEMIRVAEFACKYYYNWCAFRGSGSKLRHHEKHCEHGPPLDLRSDADATTLSDITECFKDEEVEDKIVEGPGPNSDDDDDAITKVDIDELCAGVHEEIWNMLGNPGSRLDVSTLSDFIRSDPSTAYYAKHLQSKK